MRRQRWVIKRRELEYIASKNFLRPRLDALGQYRWRGHGNHLLDPDSDGGPAGIDNAIGNLVEGDFQVVAGEGKNRILKLPAFPLVENGALFGKSSRGPVTAEARVKASKKRRSYPRFALGVHGISGYRLRVVPAQKLLEIVKDEEVVHTTPFQWTADIWYSLRLKVSSPSDGKTLVQGWVWSGGEAPEEPTVTLEADGKMGQGKDEEGYRSEFIQLVSACQALAGGKE